MLTQIYNCLRGLNELSTVAEVFKEFVQEQIGFVFSIDLRNFLSESFVEKQISLTNETLSMSVALLIVYRIHILKVIGTAEQKGSGL